MNIFKTTVLSLAACSTFATAPAMAEESDLDVSGAVMIFQGQNDSTVVTGEYSWQIGDIGGFGFVDKNLDGSGHFTNHEIRATVTGPIFVLAEAGHHPGGDFQLVGAGVRLGQLPVVRDGFRFLNVSAEKSFGANADQVKVVWMTEDLGIDDSVKIYSSGFVRIRKNAPDVAQPQGWLKVDGLPFEVGGELDVFGNNKNMEVGVKLNF